MTGGCRGSWATFSAVQQPNRFETGTKMDPIFSEGALGGLMFCPKRMASYCRCFRNPKDVQKPQEEFGCLGLGTTWKY